MMGEYSGITLYSASGMRIPLEGDGNVYNLSGIEAGIYMVTVTTPEGNLTRKLDLR